MVLGYLFPGNLQHLFHLLQIVQQGLPSGRGQSEFRSGGTVVEGLRAHNVSGIFKLPRVRTEVAIGHVDDAFEIAKAERFADHQRT